MTGGRGRWGETTGQQSTYLFPRRAPRRIQEGAMSYSPILIVHICAGSLGLLSGTAAMCFRKGSPRHVLAGRIFVALVVQAFRNFIPRGELLGVALFAVIGVTLIVLAPAKQSMQSASAVGA